MSCNPPHCLVSCAVGQGDSFKPRQGQQLPRVTQQLLDSQKGNSVAYPDVLAGHGEAPVMASWASQKPSMSSHERTALSRNKTGTVRAPKQVHGVPCGAHSGALRHRLRRKRWRERASSSCSTSSDSAYPNRICATGVQGVSAVKSRL